MSSIRRPERGEAHRGSLLRADGRFSWIPHGRARRGQDSALLHCQGARRANIG